VYVSPATTRHAGLHNLQELEVQDLNGKRFLLKKPAFTFSSDLDLARQLQVVEVKPLVAAPLPKLPSHDREMDELPVVEDPVQAMSPAVPQVPDAQDKQQTELLLAEEQAEPVFLEPVTVFCKEHEDRRLVGQLQTSVWPFQFPPSCAIHANGHRCDTSMGMMHVCGQRTKNEDGSLTICDFAICDRHMRQQPMDMILAKVLELPREVERQGGSWLMATVFFLVANAAYTPFLQTALMILACSPFYQCEFQNCWGSTMDQKFALAVYLCLVIVALLGVGLPLLQSSQLRRCRDMMTVIFFSEEYRGAYTDKGVPDKKKPLPSQANPNPLLVTDAAGTTQWSCRRS
jgi:hypothetical protein